MLHEAEGITNETNRSRSYSDRSYHPWNMLAKKTAGRPELKDDILDPAHEGLTEERELPRADALISK